MTMIISYEAVLFLTCHVFFLRLTSEFILTNDKSKLLLSNDGPAILDSNLTFYASFDGPPSEYEFTFLDNTNHPREHIVTGEQNASLSLKYNSWKYQEGRYVMSVNVSEKTKHGRWDHLASGKIEFQLSEFMIGEIVVHQEGATDDDYYATNKEITFTTIIHDPSGYFDNKVISYSWAVDEVRFADEGNNITYNFTKNGNHEVSSTVVAYVKNAENAYHGPFKWGYFQKQLSVQDPVTTINFTGNTWLKHGDLLSLNVSCDGSGSFEYCWEIVSSNETDINMTCKEPIVSTTCNFFIIRYFPKVGSHYIRVFAGNFLSHQQKTIEARIYDVSRQPQLSTVIIPIVCSVLTIVIIIIGVAYHIQHRKQYTIEVADFDFHQTEDLEEKTFFERLRDSFKNALCRTNQFAYQEEKGEENSVVN